MIKSKSELRILVLDDQGLIAGMIARQLEILGVGTVLTCSNLPDAMGHFENANFDGALLDINLGNGETSFPVAASAKEKGVPFVFLTAYDAGLVRLPENIAGASIQSKADIKSAVSVLFEHING